MGLPCMNTEIETVKDYFNLIYFNLLYIRHIFKFSVKRRQQDWKVSKSPSILNVRVDKSNCSLKQMSDGTFPEYVWNGGRGALFCRDIYQRRPMLGGTVQSVSVLSYATSPPTPHPNQLHFSSSKPLKTKRRLLYLKTQFVPRSKHFSSRL